MNLDELLGEETVSEVKETVSEVKETAKAEPKSELAPVGDRETKPKKKGKPRGGNSPVIGTNGLNLEAGDNTKILNVNLALFNMPNIDMESEEEVAQRLSDFFALYAQADLKPTVAGMAMALNAHSRQWLWSVTHDQPLGGRGNETTLPPSVTDLIKKAYILMENQWEAYMMAGKLNPVTGIFLGKNNFGYQDKTEYVLTPNQNTDSDYSAEDIRARYINSDQKRLSTINSDSEEND